jgi:hypothetical protein
VKQLLLVIAGICIVAGGGLILRRDFNTAFIVAVIGVIAWFLNYRTQMRNVIRTREGQEEVEDKADEQA